MRHALEDLVARSLPLRIGRVDVNDPVVSLSGEGWFLSIACPWDLVGPDVVFDWETDPFDEVLQKLVGTSLQSVTAEGELLVDPVFHFDSGISIVVRADSDLDPWVFRIQGIVLVGRMAAPGDSA